MSFDAHEDTDCDLGFQESVQLVEDTLRWGLKCKLLEIELYIQERGRVWLSI